MPAHHPVEDEVAHAARLHGEAKIGNYVIANYVLAVAGVGGADVDFGFSRMVAAPCSGRARGM